MGYYVKDHYTDFKKLEFQYVPEETAILYC